MLFEEDRKEKLKKLRESLTEREDKLNELLVEKHLIDEFEVKNKDGKFHMLPKEIMLCIEALDHNMNAPLELSLQAIMATVNFATSAHYDVDPVIFGETKRVPISNYFMNLCPSGGGKTTIYDIVNKSVEKFEAEERIRYAKEMEDYKILHGRWQNKMKKILNNTKDDFDVNQAIIDLGPEPESPLGWQYTIPTGTRNNVINVLNEVPFARLASDEGGEFFSGHTMGEKEGAKAKEMITTLSKIWSGGVINRGTGIKDDSIWIENRRLMMFFMLQPDMAKFLNTPIYSTQGFIHRFLITHCEEYEMPDISIDNLPNIKKEYQRMQPFHDRIYELLRLKKHFKEDKNKELELPYHKIEDDAFRLAEDYCNLLKRQARPGQPYYQWQPFVRRAFEHTIRLASNLACFERKETVDLNSMAGAIELFEFYLQQRVTLDIGVESKSADTIVNVIRFSEWFNKHPKTVDGQPKAWLSQSGPRWYTRDLSLHERNKILEEAVDRGEIKLEPRNNVTYFVRGDKNVSN